MGTFDRWFMGVLIFAVVNFLWIIFLEQYIPLVYGNILGVLCGVLFGIFGPKKS